MATHARWASVLSDAAHGPAFAFVTLILIALLKNPAQRSPTAGDCALGAVIALALGICIELLQLAIGRDASIGDVVRDAFGALAAVGFLGAMDPGTREWLPGRAARAGFLAVGTICAFILIAPPVVAGGAYLERAHRFPVLVDFDSALSRYFLGVYDGVAVDRRSLPGFLARGVDRRGLHARILDDSRWAIALWEPEPDWRPFARIAIDLANPTGELLRLQVRIRDGGASHRPRKSSTWTIVVAPHARTSWSAPLPAHEPGAPDLSAIRAVILGRSPGNRADEFYVMRMWLE